jgi:membrane-associated phospholipid phosphatase
VVRAPSVLLSVLSFVLATPGAGAAQDVDPLWRSSYRGAGWADALVIGIAGGVYFGDSYLVPHRSSAVWEGPILLDGPIRDLTVLETRASRERAATVSDYLFTGSVLHNLVFDNLLVAWALHGDPRAAFHMSVANVEAYAVAGALSAVVKTAAGRERPFGRECRRDPGYTGLCGAPTAYRAFFSAHATTTAVGAGLLCAHHLHMPLYGNRALDWAACGAGVGMTIVTGALRLTSDRHWFSDVAAGHLVGFAAGYLVPTLLFYEWGREEAGDADDTVTAFVPVFASGQIGARLVAFY